MVKASFPLSLSLFRLPPAWKVVPPASSLFIRTYSVAGIVVSGKSLLPPLPAQKLHIGVEAARREGGRGEKNTPQVSLSSSIRFREKRKWSVFQLSPRVKRERVPFTAHNRL